MTCTDDATSAVVADSNCSGSKPAVSQSCSGPVCSFTWTTGSWSSCNAACGQTSTQTRSVTCVDDASSAVVADSNCSGTKPATSQSCNGPACPTYSWTTGAWSSCNAACGQTGSQTRSVTCTNDATSAVVADSNCSGTKPTTSQSCNGAACATYSWITGGWGACSAACESTGSRSRTVQCIDDATSNIVADSNCSGSSKPATTESCTGGTCAAYGKRVIGYFTNWGIYGRGFDAQEIPMEHVTHINYAFWDVTSSGTIKTVDGYADTGKCTTYLASHPDAESCWNAPTYPYLGNFMELRLLKQDHPHVKVILSLGGWTLSKGFSDTMNSASTRTALCNNILSFMTTYDVFDGVDFDWEYPGKLGDNQKFRVGVDGPNFVTFANECGPRLKTEIPGRPLLFTAAVGCDPVLYDGPNRQIDMAAMAQQMDFINLMTYDFFGAFSAKTGHNSALFNNPNNPDPSTAAWNSGSCAAGHIANGVPASKLNLGLGTYGRGFGSVDFNGGTDSSVPGLYSTFSGAASPGTWEAGVFDYKDIIQNYVPQGTVYPDTQAMVPVVKVGNKLISYDDVCSICNKIEYIKSLGLGGSMFWEFTSDIYNDNESLFRAAHCSLNPGTCTNDPCVNVINQGYTCAGTYSINP